MTLTKDHIRDALSTVMLPTGEDPVSSGAVLNIAVCDEHASVRISMTKDAATPQPPRETLSKLGAVMDAAIRANAKEQGVHDLALIIDFVDHSGQVIMKLKGDPAGSVKPTQTKEQIPGAPTPPQNSAANGVPGVKSIIAVGAGKGGVGKSTIAVNLAIGLARKGYSVGILDGDIYGPSLPTMLGLQAIDQVVIDGALQPFLVHDVKAITMGKLVETDKPLIWRGPMAHGAFHQLIERTQWGELDYLIIDLPPGTGDVPLTLAQSVQLAGAVVVCTPQQVAQDDAVRAVNMFKSLGVEVLGVVENMSYFIGDPDDKGQTKEYDIFGRGGAQQMAQKLGLPFLGAIPINMPLRKNSDAGTPTKNFDPATAGGEQLPAALTSMTDQLIAQATLASMHRGQTKPTLTIS
ncbi:MAG: Mrp/NBP35 family ATP-binding protein [Phycisphaerales bacterium]|nr:Mrp/NBP35 family ATP-binding protein [Phycisphaerales bacterium]